MRTISLTSTVKLKNTCAAIGIFDGVHLGHQYLVKKMLAQAKALKLKSMVITFFPHPAHVLRPDVPLKYLTSLDERLTLLSRMGVDTCVVVRFNRRFAQIKPERFIKNFLVGQLGVKALFVGEDFRFGMGRAGDVALFQAMSLACGYEMHGVKALMQAGLPISSTRIRARIASGDLSSAYKLLGRFFSCRGIVVKGSGRGKYLGYPTANVEYSDHIMPKNGVYAVNVLYKQKSYSGVANLGVRPSFKEAVPKPLLEVHLFDFNHDLYGQLIEVEFIKKIREERAFPNLKTLTIQINKDAQKARSIVSKAYLTQ